MRIVLHLDCIVVFVHTEYISVRFNTCSPQDGESTKNLYTNMALNALISAFTNLHRNVSVKVIYIFVQGVCLAILFSSRESNLCATRVAALEHKSSTSGVTLGVSRVHLTRDTRPTPPIGCGGNPTVARCVRPCTEPPELGLGRAEPFCMSICAASLAFLHVEIFIYWTRGPNQVKLSCVFNFLISRGSDVNYVCDIARFVFVKRLQVELVRLNLCNGVLMT